jgi:hypothetical protein
VAGCAAAGRARRFGGERVDRLSLSLSSEPLLVPVRAGRARRVPDERRLEANQSDDHTP